MVLSAPPGIIPEHRATYIIYNVYNLKWILSLKKLKQELRNFQPEKNSYDFDANLIVNILTILNLFFYILNLCYKNFVVAIY